MRRRGRAARRPAPRPRSPGSVPRNGGREACSTGPRSRPRRRPAPLRTPRRRRAAPAEPRSGARSRAGARALSRPADDDAPVRLLALGLAAHAVDRRDRVVHDLALERVHRRQPRRLAGLEHPRRGVGGELLQLVAARLPVAADVEHQPAAHRRSSAGPPAGSAPAARRASRRACRPADCRSRPDDRHDGAVVLDVEVDVAVVVDDVEQPLEVVGGDVALLDQQRRRSSPPVAVASRSLLAVCRRPPRRRPRRGSRLGIVIIHRCSLYRFAHWCTVLSASGSAACVTGELLAFVSKY